MQTSDPRSPYDLAVIGGGLVGGAIAWGAARLGARVALLDEGDLAHRASRGNFGLVWVQGKGAGMAPYAHWTRRSARLWPDLAAALAAESGTAPQLDQPGGFLFCLSEAEFAERAALVRRMHNESGDIGTRMIGREELRALVPGLGDAVVGASFCPADGHANPLLLLRALQEGLLRAGGAYLPGQAVDRIVPLGAGFALERGARRLLCGRVVVAAGLGSARLAPMVGLAMEVRPLRGQIMVTERVKPFLRHATHIARQTREGSVMLGDSQEDVGFDTASTVPVMRQIARRNLRIFPALREARVVRSWAALRVMSPDGLPIYEQSVRHPGAWAATCHSGVTLAGAHALALAPVILEGVMPESLRSFSSERFHVPSP